MKYRTNGLAMKIPNATSGNVSTRTTRLCSTAQQRLAVAGRQRAQGQRHRRAQRQEDRRPPWTAPCAGPCARRAGVVSYASMPVTVTAAIEPSPPSTKATVRPGRPVVAALPQPVHAVEVERRPRPAGTGRAGWSAGSGVKISADGERRGTVSAAGAASGGISTSCTPRG